MFDNTFGSLSPRTRRGAVLPQMKLWGLALLLVAGLVGSTIPAHAQAQQGFVINSVQLTNIQKPKKGVIKAVGTVTGTLAGLPFTTPMGFELQSGDNPSTLLVVECAILDLELAPIHLQLLGLHVDTSRICLEINAVPGGVLGNLLCGLATGDLLIGNVLGQLLAELEDLLQGAVDEIVTRGGGGGGQSVCTGQCEILELVLGPLNLNLLGLVVELDNCRGRAVQICVSATASEGILGSLLCGLTQPFNLTLDEITQLVTRALQLLSDGILSAADILELQALLAILRL